MERTPKKIKEHSPPLGHGGKEKLPFERKKKKSASSFCSHPYSCLLPLDGLFILVTDLILNCVLT